MGIEGRLTTVHPALPKVPHNCGQLGSKCCPRVPGAPDPQAPPPFDPDYTSPAYCYGDSIYCNAPWPDGSVNASRCMHLPTFPEECGAAGEGVGG